MKTKTILIMLSIVILGLLYFIKIEKDDKDEMLKSFQSLEVSLNKSNENLDEKNKSVLNKMYNNAGVSPETVSPYYQRAIKVKDVSDEFVEYIEKLKRKLVGRNTSEENIGKHPCLLNDTNFRNDVVNFDKTKIKKLSNKIETTRKKLLFLLRDEYGVSLYSKDTAEISSEPFLKVSSSWTKIYFKNPTFVGIIISLSKLQNDSRNLEADIIKVLAKSYSICCYTLDPLFARVIPNSNAVMVGSEYKAEVVLLGIPREFEYKVIVDGKTLPMEDGFGIYKNRPLSKGVYSWDGVIKIKLNGEMKEYQFKQEYQAY